MRAKDIIATQSLKLAPLPGRRHRCCIPNLPVLLLMMALAGCAESTGASAVDTPLLDTSTASDAATSDTDSKDSSDGGPLPECLTDSDCSAPPSSCATGVCSDGRCQVVDAPDYTACDDNSICTLDDICLQGTCVGSSFKECAAKPCQAASCDPLIGCTYINDDDGEVCDDGDVCTEKDSCTAGVCAGEPSSACACDSDSDCTPLDDGNLCNGNLACISGTCKVDPASVVTCQSANACLTSVCIPSTGTCLPTVAIDGVACDDLNPCTSQDACAAGVCKGTSGQCECASDMDCAAVQGSNYNLCQGALTCQDGVCAPDVSGTVSCEAAAPPCAQTICDPQSGLCAQVASPDGSSCQRDDLCVPSGVCVAGNCEVPAGLIPCDDGNPCTADYCEPTSGCFNTPQDGTSCDDGDPCTTGDHCKTGACVPSQVLCDDGDPCTIDICKPGAQTCSHVPAEDGSPCSEASACVGGGVCQGGVCAGGTPLVCDDDNPCTSDSCEPGVGCVYPPLAEEAPCDDGDPCTQPGACEDGQCKTVPVPCNDGNPCTIDACVPGVGCVSEPSTDGQACEAAAACLEGATCQAGACVGGKPVLCDDGPCDSRECNPETGACEVTQTTEDGTPCGPQTLCVSPSTCDQGSCVPGNPLCDDGDPCTTDSCDPDSGACEFSAVTCQQSADLCVDALCAQSTGQCQQAPVLACQSAVVLFEQQFSCGGPNGWSFEVVSGDVAFDIEQTASVPSLPQPGGSGSECTLNFSEGGSFASSNGEVPHATATSGPWGSDAAITGDFVVRFWHWWETELEPGLDVRSVALIDNAGVALEEQVLPKTNPEAWHPMELLFTISGDAQGPLSLRFRFDAKSTDVNDGRGWLIDRVLVLQL